MPVSLKLHSKFCLLPESCSIFFALNLSCPRCLDWLTGTQQLTCKKFCMYVISQIWTNLAYAITVSDCRSLFPEISDWLQILQSNKMCGNCSTTFPFHTKSKTNFTQFFQTRFEIFFFRRSCLNWCLNSYEKFSIYRRLRLTQNIFCCCVWGRKIVIMNYLCQPFETLCKSASKQNVDYLSLALFSHSFKQEWHKSLEIIDRLLTEKPVIVFGQVFVEWISSSQFKLVW